MASFGLSLGDIALLSTYAYTVYKSCQNAGEGFASIATDVRSLKSLLSTLNDESTNPRSSLQRLSHAQQGELEACLEECKGSLREVQKVLRHYKSLDTKSPRFRDQLAFTTGKQTALRERIKSQSERLQQFLSGINVATFSRIEQNTEAQVVSLLEIQARLNQIHRDLLSGKRNSSMLDAVSASTMLEKEVLKDDITEVDVDISHVVSQWLDQVKHEQESTPLSSPNKEDSTVDNNFTILPGLFNTKSPKNENTGSPENLDEASHAGVGANLPPLHSPTTGPTISTIQPGQEEHENPTSFRMSAKVDLVVDVTSLKPQRIATPHRQSGYDYVRKKCGTLSHYSTTLDQYTQALVVTIKVSPQELREGFTKTIEVKRNVFKKNISREEQNVFIMEVEPQKARNQHCVMYRSLGNRTMRDSRLVRGAEVLVDAEPVVFRFQCP